MKHTTRNTLCATLALLSPAVWAATAPVAPVTPKVMLVAMFAPEAQNWIDRLHLTKEIRCLALPPSTRPSAAMTGTSACWSQAWARPTLRHRPWHWPCRRNSTCARLTSLSRALPASTRTAAHSAPLPGRIIWWSSARSGKSTPRCAQGMADRLSGHQHQGPEREAAAGLQDRSLRAQPQAAGQGVCPVAQGDTQRKQGIRGLARQIPLCACQPAAAGHAVRHAGR